MRALPRKVLQELRELVVEFGRPGAGLDESRRLDLLTALDFATKPKRSSAPARKRRETKRKTRKEVVGELRARLMERAGGACEVCVLTWTGEPHLAATDLDHFFGGSSRRSLESEEGCWMLCRAHHAQKTLNVPSRAFWLGEFLRHSAIYGYHREPQRKAQAELESIQIQEGDSK